MMMMMQKLHISKQQNAFYLHIYTSLKGEYLKNGYFSLKLFIRIWTLLHSAVLLVSVT